MKKTKKIALKSKYGLTPKQYAGMKRRQKYRCAICNIHFEMLDKEPSIDHDHDTGEIRGLLCNSCNLGLGSFRDDVVRLEAAIKYLLVEGNKLNEADGLKFILKI